MSTEPSVSDLLSLRGKVALITGATGHLGSAMARGLAEAGASVIVSSRKLDAAQAASSALPAQDKPHHGVQIDHMDESSIQRGFSDALQRAGKIDILVNNGHERLTGDWRDVSAAQFNRQMMNLTGYFLLSRLFHDHVVSRNGSGSIIMLGSMYGMVGSYPDAYKDIPPASPVACHALKGGIIQMTRHLAVYWAADHVRVNCLSPGAFPAEQRPSEIVQRLKPRIPVRRIGQPYELKGAVVFLASDASSYVTGHNLVVDGGWTAW